MTFAMAGVESALTGGDGKVLTDPPTLALMEAADQAVSREPAAAAVYDGRAAAGLDPIR
jgi:hypothetical protein